MSSERVWTVSAVDRPAGGEAWGVFHEGTRVGEHASRAEAEAAAIVAAQRARAGLHHASVLVEDADGCREIYPRRKRKKPANPVRLDDETAAEKGATGYGLQYFASKHRLALNDARRILTQVGADKKKLNDAALAFKASQRDRPGLKSPRGA